MSCNKRKSFKNLSTHLIVILVRLSNPIDKIMQMIAIIDDDVKLIQAMKMAWNMKPKQQQILRTCVVVSIFFDLRWSEA